MSPHIHRALGVGVALAAALTPATALAQAPTTVVFTTKGGHVTPIDLGKPGHSVGDEVAFDAKLIAADGSSAGSVYGTQTTIKVGSRTDIVQAMYTFELPGGNVVAGGTSRYDHRDPTGTRRGQSFDRPILGGTGSYAGARGTDTTTRTGRVDYRHTLTLVP
jgi:hypothetical protein